MNEYVINELVKMLGISKKQINEVLSLLSEGATIPFIARYRKERTGALNEDEIRSIEVAYKYQNNLMERKEDVIRLIDEKGLLTPALKENILKSEKLSEVEDLYRPFKEHKKTKATEAIKMGLEPLAKQIMSFPTTGSIEKLVENYEYDKDTCITNASYIISEWISDNAYYRKSVRNYIFNNGLITSKLKKNSNDEKKTYEVYYEYSEPIRRAKHYRVLAINRGEKEKILNVSLDYDLSNIESFLESKIIKNNESFVKDIVVLSIKDALKRLILPSIEREIRSELTLKSEHDAIDTFSVNLESLLMTRPIKHSRVLGFDPAFRTGCKLAVLNEVGDMETIAVIYPHEPKNDVVGATKTLRELISKYNIDIIAIGNGTASRESEAFVAKAINGLDVKYIIVSEAGASVYSASPLAKEEFPLLSVEQRSAISIGRRIQDPLSELVKIDPKSIGVGEYQHDVNEKELTSSLDFTVSKIVNEVGVSITTASSSILKYVSGLTKSVIKNILDYKKTKDIKTREDIKKIKGVSSKVYEQSIGFLRVPNSINKLDNTGIHPESYELTTKILKDNSLDINNINDNEFKEKVNLLDAKEIAKKYNSDEYTITDILKELLNPGLDPRDSLDAPVLKSDILTIDDLKIGMELQGTVRNVASFGAFIDIGLHDDGLVHISKMSHEFVKNPTDIVSVGNIVKCYVIDIDKEKSKVSLSLIK